MAEYPASLIPGMFVNAVDGNILEVQAFMNEFIGKILKEADCNAKVVWDIPSREDGTERSRHFEILRNGFVLCYGAVSSRKFFVPDLVTLARCVEGDLDILPALVDPNMSTVYLDKNYPREGPKEAFRAFLAACIQLLLVPTA
ncbi:hypothetical protein LOZ12_002939 [Ophidiomyces ophidiicola]|uniref:Uncharacterized protein n=1 Tax=Ophidiomyces ophidiicola TaxID=1387563 RepID=A0ACB8UYV4_9EURO|nr:hypothetical protein LOZ64_003145 [Ophidiomyces ophidiicola]KAI1953268.1 hypothetical protein LOZ62_001109 [Ophidiomyces ophidiicola]KAI2006383.1 hypothetical protein LOZ50_003108 [Ophidiomyces ophidiicola]KAI2033461.1 hypothetical protein LOZ45_000745 [Ophidiomyces ophidiicola]KAI2039303.1 hypothetical protein LOZ47_002355 [Ophidiomyces ophidiicola]